MKDVYMRPEAEVISFAPSKAIAYDPNWGWKDEVFSPVEPNGGANDYGLEGSGSYEG